MSTTIRLNDKRVQSAEVAPSDEFDQLEKDRIQGKLSQKVTKAAYRYETSQTHSGLLDRVGTDSSRQVGHFRDGEFVPA